MFFPSDQFVPDIMTESFGAITIETAKTVMANDNIYFVGRTREFLSYTLNKYASAMVVDYKTNTVANVATTTTTTPEFNFLNYLKSFNDISIFGLASDFQDYANEIYMTTRPFSFVNKSLGFDDFISPVNTQDFITYINKFKDLYIVSMAVRTDMDLV